MRKIFYIIGFLFFAFLQKANSFPLSIYSDPTAAIGVCMNESEIQSDWRKAGLVAVRYVGDFKSNNETLEKEGLEELKKKVVAMNAHVVFINKKNIIREYGELPVIEYYATAYYK